MAIVPGLGREAHAGERRDRERATVARQLVTERQVGGELDRLLERSHQAATRLEPLDRGEEIEVEAAPAARRHADLQPEFPRGCEGRAADGTRAAHEPGVPALEGPVSRRGRRLLDRFRVHVRLAVDHDHGVRDFARLRARPDDQRLLVLGALLRLLCRGPQAVRPAPRRGRRERRAAAGQAQGGEERDQQRDGAAQTRRGGCCASGAAHRWLLGLPTLGDWCAELCSA